MDRVASLEEIERHWSLDDVARMNALLDMKADIRAGQDRP